MNPIRGDLVEVAKGEKPELTQSFTTYLTNDRAKEDREIEMKMSSLNELIAEC